MWLLYAFSFLIGSMIGSFLNVIIYRVPRNLNFVTPRSSCPGCAKLIYWYENIPILSYIILRGKCSKCSSGISVGYPLVEILMGLFSLWITPLNFIPLSLLNYFFSMGVFACFLCIIVIDARHKIIPNGINLYLAITFFLFSVMSNSWEFWLLGAVIGILFPLTVTWIFYLLKGEVGLGGGDIKLYGALGLFLGPLGIVQNIFLSCFVGALFGGSLLAFKVIDRKTPIPFGPFIIIVSTVQIFLPKQFLWFMNLIMPIG
jgi:prepilin signal peptidase PulO-like enzyme (type II secretory pathway)